VILRIVTIAILCAGAVLGVRNSRCRQRAGDQASSGVACGGRASGSAPSRQLVPAPPAQWTACLTPEQFRIMRQKGTERAFTGRYWNETAPGVYRCAACGQELFLSDSKFDAGCGWPSFSAPADGGSVETREDTSYGMLRTEVVCCRCGSHLGHVFSDGPKPTGLRYCINSVALSLEMEAHPAAPDPHRQ